MSTGVLISRVVGWLILVHASTQHLQVEWGYPLKSAAMNARFFDSRHLDVLAFAEHAGRLNGELPLESMQRLQAFVAPETLPSPGVRVSWQAGGESRQARGQVQIFLHLQASATLDMTCQRCLAPMSVNVKVDRQLRFVPGDDAAAAEDADSEDDVLALTASLNLPFLIEDELVLALPWVPRHEVCAHPLPLPVAVEAEAEEAPHPFAALALLKRPPGS